MVNQSRKVKAVQQKRDIHEVNYPSKLCHNLWKITNKILQQLIYLARPVWLILRATPTAKVKLNFLP